MRYKVIKLASVALAIFVTACHEQSEYLFGAKEAFIEVNTIEENDGLFTPEAQVGYGLLTSNARWKAESLSDWLTCSTTGGEFNDTIRFSMPENKGNTRIGKIVVYNTVGEQMFDTLTIRQQCALEFIPEGYKIKIESDELKETLSGVLFSDINFKVTSSTAWRVFTKGTDRWSTVMTKKGSSSGSGSLVVSKNDGLVERSMYAYVQSVEFPSLKDSVLITQAGRPLALEIVAPTNKKILLDQSETQFLFSVKGDGKWKIENIPAWMELEKVEYEGDANVSVKVSATTVARSVELTIKSLVQTNKKDVLTIDQKVIPNGRLKDSLALIAIYQATNGDKWNYRWKPELELSEGNWPGIFVDVINGELRVIDLSLIDWNLEGTLPNEIGWLTEVTKIKIQKNKLSGPLPASINRLTNLTNLYISNNQLSGEFPDVSNLQKLSLLEMDFNRFSGEFPESFKSLKKLTTVKMKYNNFDVNTCIPSPFGGWKLLQYINPQRGVYGDPKTDYNLKDCTK